MTEAERLEMQRGLRSFLRSLPLHRRIAVLRVAQGLERGEVVERLKGLGAQVAVNTLSRWESGTRRPRRAVLQALEQLYEVPAGVLTELSIVNGADGPTEQD